MASIPTAWFTPSAETQNDGVTSIETTERASTKGTGASSMKSFRPASKQALRAFLTNFQEDAGMHLTCVHREHGVSRLMTSHPLPKHFRLHYEHAAWKYIRAAYHPNREPGERFVVHVDNVLDQLDSRGWKGTAKGRKRALARDTEAEEPKSTAKRIAGAEESSYERNTTCSAQG